PIVANLATGNDTPTPNFTGVGPEWVTRETRSAARSGGDEAARRIQIVARIVEGAAHGGADVEAGPTHDWRRRRRLQNRRLQWHVCRERGPGEHCRQRDRTENQFFH